MSPSDEWTGTRRNVPVQMYDTETKTEVPSVSVSDEVDVFSKRVDQFGGTKSSTSPPGSLQYPKGVSVNQSSIVSTLDVTRRL